MSAVAKSKRIPPALAKVRKELPPPGKIIKSKKQESRKRAREKLHQELKTFRAA